MVRCQLSRVKVLYPAGSLWFPQTEFHPGVPWKGLQNIDPENDPDVTPGSVPTGPTINTTIQDVNRYLLKSGGKHKATPVPVWESAVAEARWVVSPADRHLLWYQVCRQEQGE